jgi:hypothetical protein
MRVGRLFTAYMFSKSAIVFAVISLFLISSRAAIIGTNVPATPLTAERVAALPAWKIYFENSARQKQADQHFIHAELRAHGLTQATLPPKTNNAKGVDLDRPESWYRGETARHIADVLVSFQTPAGGWSKNTDFTKNLRHAGG